MARASRGPDPHSQTIAWEWELGVPRSRELRSWELTQFSLLRISFQHRIAPNSNRARVRLPVRRHRDLVGPRLDERRPAAAAAAATTAAAEAAAAALRGRLCRRHHARRRRAAAEVAAARSLNGLSPRRRDRCAARRLGRPGTTGSGAGAAPAPATAATTTTAAAALAGLLRPPHRPFHA